MKTKQEVLKVLEAVRDEVRRRYEVRDLALFGSLARGEQGASSDIDILVDFGEGADLFDLVGLSGFLEERLHEKVDIVPRRALREELRDAILKEAVYLP